MRYYGCHRTPERRNLNGANLPFNFHLIQTHWQASAVAAIINTYERLLPAGAWPNYVLGNHDQSRLASRIGLAQARVAAMLLLTLRGTPTMYYGDELAMTDVPIAADQVQDPAEKNEPGKGRGRDPERSPMLWVDAPNAGFTPPDATALATAARRLAYAECRHAGARPAQHSHALPASARVAPPA